MLYNKEIITLKMDTKKNKEKQKALINAIISQRKESAKTISNIVHNIMESNISRKKFIFIKRIIIERKKSAIKIQTYFRSYIIQKKVKYYITKIRTCFAIESGFSQIFKNVVNLHEMTIHFMKLLGPSVFLRSILSFFIFKH